MNQQAEVLTPYQRAMRVYNQRNTEHLWLDHILDSPKWLVFLIAIHYAFGLVYRNLSANFGFIHVVLAFGVGVMWAISSRYPIRYAAYASAYITGAEILWRQNAIPVFWEAGKYFSIVILGLALLRMRKITLPKAPMFYLFCLLPSALYTVILSPATAHARLANVLSGPAALFVMLIFFANMKLSRDDLRRIFLLVAIPVAGIAAVVVLQLQTQTITWGNDSNSDVAGFGANQVSTALGLAWTGMVLMVMYLLKRTQTAQLAVIAPLTLLLVVVNFLTFSRGGLLGSLVAVVIAAAFMLLIPEKRALFIGTIIIVLIFLALVFPSLDRFTEGNLSKRYQIADDNLDVTHRDVIARNELEIFLEYPVTGIGVGQSKQLRFEMTTENIASHTEFTRLLAEHGSLGVLANVLMIVIGLEAVFKQKSWPARAMSLALVWWSFFYMSHAATRTAAFAFAFALAYAQLLPEEAKALKAALPKPRIVPKPIFIPPSFENGNTAKLVDVEVK